MEKLIAAIKALRERMAAIDTRQQEIESEVETKLSGKFSDELRAEYDGLGTEYDAKKAELETAEADLKRLQSRADRKLPDGPLPRRTSPGSGAPLGDDDPSKPPRTDRDEGSGASEKFQLPANVRRHFSLLNFTDSNGRKGEMSAEERCYRFGMFMLARAATDLPNRFGHLRQAVDFAREKFGLSTEGGPDFGSVLVREEFGMDLIDLRERYGVVRQLFKRRPMSSDTRTDPRRAGGLTAYFVGEGAAGTESTKEWDHVRLTAKKLMVLSRYTNELSMDAVMSIGDDLAGEIAYAFAVKEDDCGINGDGTSTYGRITGARASLNAAAGAPTTTSAGGVIIAAGNAYSEITLANFHSVLGVLPMYARTLRTRWLCSHTFYHTVMERLMLASGGVPAAEIREGSPVFRFLGYEVALSVSMPTTEANSQVCALLGDFSQGASFGDRSMDSIEFSDQASVGGQSLWERDEIGIKGTERFDINVHDTGSTTAAGPIVGLQTLNS